MYVKKNNKYKLVSYIDDKRKQHKMIEDSKINQENNFDRDNFGIGIVGE